MDSFDTAILNQCTFFWALFPKPETHSSIAAERWDRGEYLAWMDNGVLRDKCNVVVNNKVVALVSPAIDLLLVKQRLFHATTQDVMRPGTIVYGRDYEDQFNGRARAMLNDARSKLIAVEGETALFGSRFARLETMEDIAARTNKIAAARAKWGDDWRGARKEELEAMKKAQR